MNFDIFYAHVHIYFDFLTGRAGHVFYATPYKMAISCLGESKLQIHIMAYKRSGMNSYTGLIPYLHGVVKRRKHLQGFQRLKREKMLYTSDDERRHNKLILSNNKKQLSVMPGCGLWKW